jgi:hypothetical protein
MRSTLNSNFHQPKDNILSEQYEFDLAQNVDEDSKPYAHQYDKPPKKLLKTADKTQYQGDMRKTNSISVNDPCGVNTNFH